MLENECKQKGITIIWNENAKFIYNSGYTDRLIRLHHFLVNQNLDPRIYVHYDSKGSLYYTPVDERYDPCGIKTATNIN